MSTDTLERIDVDVDLDLPIPCQNSTEHDPATHRVNHPIGNGTSCIYFACEDCTMELVRGLAEMSRHSKVCPGYHRNNPLVDCTVCETEDINVEDFKIRSLT